MARIGVTGHDGFVGRHLVDALERIEGNEVRGLDLRQHDLTVPGEPIDRFVEGLDVLIHVAGVNRPETPEGFVSGNVEATRNLMDAVERSGRRPLVIYASTVQAERDNDYGRSKLAAEKVLEEYADRIGLSLAILRITNVFGAGCRPFYNSVVATFCHLVASGEEPQVANDAEVTLVSVNDVVGRIVELATQGLPDVRFLRETLTSSNTLRVSELKERLLSYRDMRVNCVIPDFQSRFDRELYATLVSYFQPDHWAISLERHGDERGELVEVFRFAKQGQVFFSTTKPGVTRGNHYHTRKTERFLVVEGEAVLRLRPRKSSEVREYQVSGAEPCVVEIPIGYVHNITNVGSGLMVLLVWVNELFDPDDPDTFFEEV